AAETSPPAESATPHPSPRPSHPNGSHQSGTVGDLVPILPAEGPLPQAEPVEPEPVATPPKHSQGGTVGEMVPLLEGNATIQTDWSQPPPVRQKPASPVARPRTTKTSDTAQRPAAPATMRIPPPRQDEPAAPRKPS